jgi:hypothetical protein
VSVCAHSKRRITPLADEIAVRIRDSAPHLGEEDEVAVRLLAGQLARITLVERWLDQEGCLVTAVSPC